MSKEKTRYTDEELEEFREIILRKLESAKSEFDTLQGQLKSQGDASSNNNYLTLDDGANTAEKENLNQLAAHQLKFIKSLEAALIRITNKTYPENRRFWITARGLPTLKREEICFAVSS